MTSFYDFLPEVMPNVPGCPVPVAINAIRNATIDLCKKSKIWRIEHDPITVDNTVHTYDLEPPSGTRIVDIVWAAYGKKELSRKTEEQLAAISDKWNTDTGIPDAYFRPAINQIRLFRTPQVTMIDGLTLRAALTPTPLATEVTDDVFDEWHEAVASGALWRLMSMKDVSWSSPQNAETHALMAASGMASAKSTAEGSRHTRVSRSVQYGGV